MRSIRSIFAIFVGYISISVYAVANNDSQSHHALQPQTVTIASAMFRPPYILPDERSGYELDIIRAAFADQHIKVLFQFSSRNRQMLHFEQKKVDAIMTVNKHTGVSGFLSDEYIQYKNVAISLAKKNIQLTGIADLANYSVVAFLNARNVLGQVFHDMAEQNRAYLEVSPQIKQNKMLYLNRVDVVIADGYVFQELNQQIRRDVDISQPLHFHRLFDGPNYSMSFHDPELRDSFNLGLANIRANGQYQQIKLHYLQDYQH
ncbi:substrate-binding periplasmic protein [Shewanella aestuarii]|uniref:Amino acid ABC transporter substrate-binding protein n=1 Tax=Shewanella aestuarii TaxID=1028752 RepID=A0A6G9QMT4_9GAMM|nr:transporter substrate-binding domain-containing protein [Shewanella aestuarii]QIR15792.1 amino acid ABC transporter substrate-binding protein [Shewanella aestuarii]